jgi:hypothetical protein
LLRNSLNFNASSLLNFKNNFLLLFFIFLAFFGQTQTNNGLSTEVRAYLFHIVRKSPILEKNIGKAFEYVGPNIKLLDGGINYDSLELLIINDPTLLIIRNDLIAKSPKGLLAEASNKTALWELCKQIQLTINGGKQQTLITSYLDYFFDSLPNAVSRGKIYNELLTPSSSPIFQTNLSLNDRIQLLEAIGIKDRDEQKLIFDAQSYAINKTVESRALEIFKILGGQVSSFENLLIACGDGSYTSGLLEERDKDEYGEWNKGLPKAIGFFPYDVYLEGTKKPELKSKRIVSRWVETVGMDKETVLHFDVWGYNSTKQTTVVIEKDGAQYHLFGSEKTRFLSPDSTFSSGITFQTIINQIIEYTFKDLKGSIEGKEGYNAMIKQTQNDIQETLLAIHEKESSYENLNKVDFVTKKKPSREMRKLKKKNKNGGPIDMQPTTKSRRKAKSNNQEELIDLYLQYDELQNDLQNLILEKVPVQEEYSKKKKLIDAYSLKMGVNWMPYTVKDGLYLYKDGARFDLYTQEFTFPASKEKSTVEIRLISIPEDFEGENADEVMLHMTKLDAEPFFDANIQLELMDVFESDKFNFNAPIFTLKDSSDLKVIFTQFKKNPVPILVYLDAFGIGEWNGDKVQRNSEQIEISNYPGTTDEERKSNRASIDFKRLRSSHLLIKMDRNLILKINSSTDPVKSNLDLNLLNLNNLTKEYSLSKNEVLSALRCVTLLDKLQNELNMQSTKYLSQSDSKKFIDKLEEAIGKAKIEIAGNKIRIKDFK